MSTGGVQMVMTDQAKKDRVVEAAAKQGHQIGGWVRTPNSYWTKVFDLRGFCQRPGCDHTEIINLTPWGWVEGSRRQSCASK